MAIELFDDQKELLEALRNSIRCGNKNVLMQAATGSGKTQISAAMVAGSVKKGTRSVFIVPRKELRRQTSRTFNDHNIPHSFISSGMAFNPFSQTFIATTATLANRLEDTGRMNLVICDEVHYAGGAMDRIIDHYKKQGAIIVGLSATPTKLNGTGLGIWFDDMVCGKSIRWLIDNKRLSDYKSYIVDIPDLSMIKMVAGDYNQGQLAGRMESDRVLVGNAIQYYRNHAFGRLGVTYTTSRKHSEIVAEEFRKAGVPAANIDGTMDDDQRSQIIKAFARRELLQLVNCELLTFGFDLASASGMDVTIECLTDLQPTKSLAKQMQKWGRVLRMKQQPAAIFDHAGNIMDNKGNINHGFPCADREWTLAGRARGEGGQKERSIAVVQCEKCYFAYPPNLDRKCPNCGHISPIKEKDIKTVAGELKEVEAQNIAGRPPPNRVGQKYILMKVARGKGIKNPEAYADAIIKRQEERKNAY